MNNPIARWRTRRADRIARIAQAREARHAAFAADLTNWSNRELIEGALALPDPVEAGLCMAEWKARHKARLAALINQESMP